MNNQMCMANVTAPYTRTLCHKRESNYQIFLLFSLNFLFGSNCLPLETQQSTKGEDVSKTVFKFSVAETNEHLSWNRQI